MPSNFESTHYANSNTYLRFATIQGFTFAWFREKHIEACTTQLSSGAHAQGTRFYLCAVPICASSFAFALSSFCLISLAALFSLSSLAVPVPANAAGGAPHRRR